MIQASERPRSRPRTRLLALLAGIAVVVVLVDQWTKYLVVEQLPLGERVPVLGAALQWLSTRNSGGAFSFGSGMTWIFSLVAIAMVVTVIVLARRIGSTAWAAVFGLALGGTIGNLLDRLFRPPSFGLGEVVDFIYVPWLMPAIFNLADVAISSAAVLFVLLMLLDVRLDGSGRHGGAPANVVTIEPSPSPSASPGSAQTPDADPGEGRSDAERADA